MGQILHTKRKIIKTAEIKKP